MVCGQGIYPRLAGKRAFHFCITSNKISTHISGHNWSNMHILQQWFVGFSTWEELSGFWVLDDPGQCDTWNDALSLALATEKSLCGASSILDGKGGWQRNLYMMVSLNLSRCLGERVWIALWMCCFSSVFIKEGAKHLAGKQINCWS